MKLGVIVDGFVPPPHPKNLVLEGAHVRLEPLSASRHAEALFAAFALDKMGENWTYLPYGPFENLASFTRWVQEQEGLDDPVFFAIMRKSTLQPLGVASYLRIAPFAGSIEVGHIHFSPLLQRTIHATEAMYLMMKWAFEAGYRRYEWKCDALNVKSRKAALRLGFSYEGVFRQAAISKGRNRDTAWFAIIDKEWAELSKCYATYLSGDNFDANGQPNQSLSALTHPLLYKMDDMDFS